jgi:outer membrane lipoprotein carrier protein
VKTNDCFPDSNLPAITPHLATADLALRGAVPASFWSFCLCLLHFLTVSAVSFSQDDLSEAVVGLQRRYASMACIAAEFRQTYRGPGVDTTESGRLWMKRPGLMRWEYTSPETKLFVADGRESWLYTPADHQALVRSFSREEMHSTPLRFLLGQGEILKSFAASREREFRPTRAGALLVRLTPRSSDPEYAFVVLECDAASYDLHRLIIREPTGNTSEFEFTRVVSNPKVNKGLFQFKVPRGVEVIRLEDK